MSMKEVRNHWDPPVQEKMSSSLHKGKPYVSDHPIGIEDFDRKELIEP